MKKLKKTWFVFIVLILSVGIVEVVLRFLTMIVAVPNNYSDYYKKVDWGRAYFNELRQLKMIFVPFVEWQRNSFTGEYININADRTRKTWNPEGQRKPNTPKIFVFGGSALWGTGSRDEYTIPSYLSKNLHNKQLMAYVDNYGETAYTFTQELIKLVLLLREGQRPHGVIFYDGVNDIFAAYQSGIPGNMTNAEIIANRLYSPPTILSTVTMLAKDLYHHSMILVSLNKIRTFLFAKTRFREVASDYNEEKLQSLAEGIVREYLRSMDILSQLSKAYGFKYLCFWQPVIYLEKEITVEERKRDPRVSDQALHKLSHYTHNLLRQRQVTNFVDLSGVFAQHPGTYYIDYCHLTEDGNRMVANRMSPIIHRQFFDAEF